MAASSRLDRASVSEARELLARCCGSSGWVKAMLSRRPFGSDERLFALAREVWFALGTSDWLEAFNQHPTIGDRAALAARFDLTRDLSIREQSSVGVASDAVLESLERGNYAYESKFGFIFIVCATGKSADEMLARLEARLANPSDVEIRIAAEEEAQITALRLARLDEPRDD
jgi:2-oxo-4-hydroxy-4-carboxy-5-ureidoimidazoline decarboxylase